MKFKFLLITASLGLLSVSCIDDSYDLSDVDTTSRVEVNDLVIPVNFGDVTLSDVIKIDESDSDLQIVNIDGVDYYVLRRSGSFDSKSILIKKPSATKPTLESKHEILEKGVNGVFEIPELGNDFTFDCNNVDESIIEITKATVSDMDFTITFNAIGDYSNVHLQLPKGMTGTASIGSYDPTTGVWTIPSMKVTSTSSVTFTATEIDFTQNDFTFADHRFDFTSRFSILDGIIDVPGETMSFDIDFGLSDLDVQAISGKISYEIEGMDIESISLGNLPKFLQSDRTDIKISNPLLCLQTTNPIADNHLSFTAGLTITANRDGESSKSYSSDMFTIGYDAGNGPYNTILSPSRPTNADIIPDDYRTDYKWTQFAELGSVLAGSGLPNSLNVSADSPMIPEQTVTDFELGSEIPGVVGSYELFAPLALAQGSLIVYTDTKDGWGEDVNCLTINNLTLTANGTNNTPLDAQLTIYPLNSKGERIGVEFTSTTLAAGAVNEPITFTLSGEFTDLDGVTFEAVIEAQDDQTLSPQQTIVFSDIRARVTGYYQKEL